MRLATVAVLAAFAGCAVGSSGLPTMPEPVGTCAGGVFAALRFEVVGGVEPAIRFVPVGVESTEPVQLVWPTGYHVTGSDRPVLVDSAGTVVAASGDVLEDVEVCGIGAGRHYVLSRPDVGH
jgi:hypothetical protein